MVERHARLAIAGSLLWLLIATLVVLRTHADAVTRLGAGEWSDRAPDAAVLMHAEPRARSPRG